MASSPGPTPTPVANSAGTSVPGGGWMEPTGLFDARGRVLVRQATRGGLAGLVNGTASLPAGVAGTGLPPLGGVVRLGVHPSDTLAAGDTLGPVAGDWYCRKGQPGFRVLGPSFAGFVAAIADPYASGALTTSLRHYALTSEIAGRADWTAAALYVTTGSGGALVAASPAETVDVQTCWGLMRAGVPCPATDTGARSPDTGRRRFRLDTVVLAADVATTACLTDGSQGTVTRRIPGAAGPEG